MTDQADLYGILQVDPCADEVTLRASYRRLARLFHPDVARDGESERRMAEINSAWEVLGNRERRAAYDEQRLAPRFGYVAPRAHPAGTRSAAFHASARDAAHGATHDEAGPGQARGGWGPAGPPPGRPQGSLLAFGRYAGWTIGEIGRHDPEFLEWLERTPSGRVYRDEIDTLLRRLGYRVTSADPLARPGRFRT